MEDCRYEGTYSGTPQGGLCSPILMNVVLHRFDYWLEDKQGANPPRLTSKQQQVRISPEDARHKRNLARRRAQLKGRIPMGGQTPEGLRHKIKTALAARNLVPCNLPRMADRLQENLGVTRHPHKTQITHWIYSPQT